MSGSMSRLMLTAAVSLLSVAFTAGAAMAISIEFDENGNCGVCTKFEKGPDPSFRPLVTPDKEVLIYTLPEGITPPVRTQTVRVNDPDGQLSDIVRFVNKRGQITGPAN